MLHYAFILKLFLGQNYTDFKKNESNLPLLRGRFGSGDPVVLDFWQVTVDRADIVERIKIDLDAHQSESDFHADPKIYQCILSLKNVALISNRNFDMNFRLFRKKLHTWGGLRISASLFLKSLPYGIGLHCQRYVESLAAALALGGSETKYLSQKLSRIVSSTRSYLIVSYRL